MILPRPLWPWYWRRSFAHSTACRRVDGPVSALDWVEDDYFNCKKDDLKDRIPHKRPQVSLIILDPDSSVRWLTVRATCAGD